MQVYIVRVERENQRVASCVMRRYSEFQELHRKLVMTFPLIHLPSLSGKYVHCDEFTAGFVQILEKYGKSWNLMYKSSRP